MDGRNRAVLIDTSFLVALTVSRDPNHAKAVAALRTLRPPLIVPMPVFPEVFYLVTIRLNYLAARNLYDRLQREPFVVEPLTLDDRIRIGSIMDKYHDAEFDFVDMAIMAVAERLKITRICTFDRRDFPVFRPQHCDYLELLP